MHSKGVFAFPKNKKKPLRDVCVLTHARFKQCCGQQWSEGHRWSDIVCKKIKLVLQLKVQCTFSQKYSSKTTSFYNHTTYLISLHHTKYFTWTSLVFTLKVNTTLWIFDRSGKVRIYLLRSENSSVQLMPRVANGILLHATGDKMRGNLIKVSYNKIIITFTAPCQCCSPFHLQCCAFKLVLSDLMPCYVPQWRSQPMTFFCESKERNLKQRHRKSQTWTCGLALVCPNLIL